MKIIFTIDSMQAGGAERVLAEITKKICQNNLVIILMLSVDQCFTFYKLNKNVKLVALKKEFPNSENPYKRLKALIKYLKKEKPDLVISFLHHINVYSYFACKKLNIPHIVSERNDPNKIKNKLILKLKNYVYKNADYIVCQTEDAALYYKNIGCKNIDIIPNPIKEGIIYKEYKPINKEKKIITVCRLEEQKNIPNLLKAFMLVNKNNSNVKLSIYGDGSKKDELIKICKDLKIEDKVSFEGNHSDWGEIEKNADCFVLSSDFEGMPNALMEALAMGIPSISTNCPIGGPKTLITNNVNGLLVPIKNEIELNKGMLKILNDTDFAKKISKANINFKEKYSVDNIVTMWEKVIDKTIILKYNHTRKNERK